MMYRKSRIKRPKFPTRLDPVQKRQLKNLKAPKEIIEKAMKMEFNVIDAATGKPIHLS